MYRSVGCECSMVDAKQSVTQVHQGGPRCSQCQVLADEIEQYHERAQTRLAGSPSYGVDGATFVMPKGKASEGLAIAEVEAEAPVRESCAG